VSRIDSSAPPEANPQVRRPERRPGPRGPVGVLRESTAMGWRWLIRMRTALYLLGLLALLTLVATVVPQQPNVPGTVESWLAGEEGPGAGISRALGWVGAFDVYGSAVFLALLLLLFLSLTACLIPRLRAFVRLVRRSQPPLVRGVGRTDLTTHLATEASPEEVHATAARLLVERRWRVRDASAPDAPDRGSKPAQVAAEKGLWSREGGSLAFHLSFYVLLAAIVFGQLLTFEGQRGLVEGEAGFVDTEVSYWSYRPGRWWGGEDHRGWRLDLDAFEVDWVRDPLAPGAGQPTTFRSDVTVTPRDGAPYVAVVDSNRPLTVEGMKIHQLDWGYSPRLVVEVDGEVVHDRFLTAQLADGGGFYRTAVKAPGADPDVGLDVFLYPFAPDGEDGRPQLTGAPWADAPVVIVSQYRGNLRLGETQQTINELDTSALELQGGAYLRPGQTVEIDGVTIAFPELRRWVGFQVSHRPQIPWLLVGSALLVAGLVPALYAYRRRWWVLASTDATTGRTLLTVAGRTFQRPQAFEEEHARLVAELADATGATPLDPDDDPARPPTPAPAGTAPGG
jgi:cytochrome c biogenesis protein